MLDAAIKKRLDKLWEMNLHVSTIVFNFQNQRLASVM